MMYVEWCSVCNCVVIMDVELFVDNSGVYVFHVCFNACGIVYVVECCLLC